MSRRKRAAAEPAAAEHRRRAFWFFALASTGIYLYAAVALWPSIDFAPAALDDESLLSEFAARSWAGILAYDHFGHLRPAKNLLFWLIAHDVLGIAAVRAAILVAFLVTGAAVQQLSTTLLRSPAWGLVATSCWMLNPTAAGVVAWLSAANHVLCLLGVLLYLKLAPRAHAMGFTSLGALFGLLLALASHELAIVAPLLLVAYSSAFGLGPIRWRKPIVVGSMLSIVLWFSLRLAIPAPDLEYRFTAATGQVVLSSMRYLLLNCRLWLWQPGAFGVFFNDQPEQHTLASTICWLAVATGMFAWWKCGRTDPVVTFGLQWSLLWLLPVVNLVPLGNTPVAQHYLYLPSIGFALLVARLAQQAVRSVRAGLNWLAVPLPLLVLAWQPEYWHTRAAWGDPIELYATTIANDPSNIEARANLVAAYLDRQRYQEADRLLTQSLAIAPQDRALLRNRFELLYATGRDEEALVHLDAHASLREHEYQVKRGLLLMRLARHEEAVAVLRRALGAASDAEQRLIAGYWLATVLVRIGDRAEARALIDRLLVESPAHRELRNVQRLLSEP